MGAFLNGRSINKPAAYIAATSYTVKLTIRNKFDGEPIAGAKIKLHNYEDLSDINGRCSFEVLETNDYILTVSKDGYFSHIEVVQISNRDISLNIALDAVHLNLLAGFDMGIQNNRLTLSDYSGKNNHATMNGFTQSSFRQDGSLYFDGSTNFITTPISQNIFNGPVGATYEAIVQRPIDGGCIAGDSGPVENCGVQFHYSITSGTLIRNFIAQDYAGDIAAQSMPSGYYHVLMCYNSSVIRTYINGEQKAEVDTGNRIVCDTPIIIGRRNANATTYFSGNMKIFNIYNKALTPAEVTQSFNRYKNSF